MTKPKPRHKGEPIRIMSGDHGTALVEDGDVYPDWFTAPPAPADPEQVVDDEE